MRFRLLTILSGLLISGQLFAQEQTGGSPLSFGVRAGIIVNQFSDGQPHTSSNTGYTIGGLIEYSFSPLFSIQTEPAYMLQGGQFVRFSDDSRFGLAPSVSSQYTTENNVRLHGIDLPLFAKLKLNVGEGFRPHVLIGGTSTYNFYAENNFERTYYFNQTFSTTDGYEVVTSEYESFHFAVVGGLGSSFDAGNKTISLDFRYRYGISPIKKSYSYVDLFSVQDDLYGNSFYMTIGLQF